MRKKCCPCHSSESLYKHDCMKNRHNKSIQKLTRMFLDQSKNILSKLVIFRKRNLTQINVRLFKKIGIRNKSKNYILIQLVKTLESYLAVLINKQILDLFAFFVQLFAEVTVNHSDVDVQKVDSRNAETRLLAACICLLRLLIFVYDTRVFPPFREHNSFVIL
jgi:hypothetical protein